MHVIKIHTVIELSINELQNVRSNAEKGLIVYLLKQRIKCQ